MVLKDVKEQALPGQNVWLNLRGVNYGCDIFINGTRLNKKTHHGIFLRQSYNISGHVNKNGSNRLALIVYPSDPVGNSNGGQGGDGTIAKSGAHQYVAGRDRIQPIPDRNTGIWDKVTTEKTGAIRIKNPHIITLVPGIREPTGILKPAILKVSSELENASPAALKGTLRYVSMA